MEQIFPYLLPCKWKTNPQRHMTTSCVFGERKITKMNFVQQLAVIFINYLPIYVKNMDWISKIKLIIVSIVRSYSKDIWIVSNII